MPHISFSELKNWDKCPHYHKLVHLDKLTGFEGNVHTAFGTAVHDVCEKILMNDSDIGCQDLFEVRFLASLKALPEHIRSSLDKKLVTQMRQQGRDIVVLVLDAVKEYFGAYEVISTEERLMEPISEYPETKYSFKGFVDLVIKTEDGKHHVIDWKTCSWGWDARRRSEPMTTYQLTYYKHYFAIKHGIKPEDVETHFALLKRTSKNDRVEFFRVTSGPKKTSNAVNFLKKALHNITNKKHIKNRLACRDKFGTCEFFNTTHCR
jgi:hypothetical protein